MLINAYIRLCYNQSNTNPVSNSDQCYAIPHNFLGKAFDLLPVFFEFMWYTGICKHDYQITEQYMHDS